MESIEIAQTREMEVNLCVVFYRIFIVLQCLAELPGSELGQGGLQAGQEVVPKYPEVLLHYQRRTGHSGQKQHGWVPGMCCCVQGKGPE